jgi:hypothetical protein
MWSRRNWKDSNRAGTGLLRPEKLSLDALFSGSHANESVKQAYLTIASSPGMVDMEAAGVEKTCQTLPQSRKRWKVTFFFDNATSALKNILSQNEYGHVLFTSRNQKLAVKLASPSVLTIPDADQTSARDIFE